MFSLITTRKDGVSSHLCECPAEEEVDESIKVLQQSKKDNENKLKSEIIICHEMVGICIVFDYGV